MEHGERNNVMSFEIYTIIPEPFRLGGSLKGYIKTTIDEYQRIDIGQGYFGILFENKDKKLWHIALEDCGALIGTLSSKAALIKQTRGDVASGTKEIFESQIEMGKRQMKQANFIEREEWLSKFRKEK